MIGKISKTIHYNKQLNGWTRVAVSLFPGNLLDVSMRRLMDRPTSRLTATSSAFQNRAKEAECCFSRQVICKLSFATRTQRKWIKGMSGDTSDSNGVDRLQKQNRIVMRILEINSDELRCEAECCGIDVEMLSVRNSFEGGKMMGDEAHAKLAELQKRIESLAQKRTVNAKERDRLQRALDEVQEVASDAS